VTDGEHLTFGSGNLQAGARFTFARGVLARADLALDIEFGAAGNVAGEVSCESPKTLTRTKAPLTASPPPTIAVKLAQSVPFWEVLSSTVSLTTLAMQAQSIDAPPGWKFEAPVVEEQSFVPAPVGVGVDDAGDLWRSLRKILRPAFRDFAFEQCQMPAVWQSWR
jgi:hypothetical protein